MPTIITAQHLPAQPYIGIIVSEFNEEVTEMLHQHAMARLDELNFLHENITVVWVPGAVEIPVVAQALAETQAYDALICLGAVIRGETSHYDYVCQQVSQGCQQVALAHHLPVIFGVLMTDDEKQAFERVQKGSEAVDCALQMISILQQIREEK